MSAAGFEGGYSAAIANARRAAKFSKITDDENENNALISTLNPVDPKLETLDPTPNIHELFQRFNYEFFSSKLSAIEVCWSPRMTRCAGMCYYQRRSGYCSVRLSKPLLQLRSRRDLVETLLHEMIHAFLFVTQNNDKHESHGDEFHRHMRRINSAIGSRITVYHSFHDEVDHYLVHWWRCDGVCRSRSPYYGYVKRAMNRAPSHLDLWWNDHVRDCGGTFVKVKEPEGFGQKKAKKADVKKVQPQPKAASKFFTSSNNSKIEKSLPGVATIENLLASNKRRNPANKAVKPTKLPDSSSNSGNSLSNNLPARNCAAFVDELLVNDSEAVSLPGNHVSSLLPCSSSSLPRTTGHSPSYSDDEDLCIIPDDVSIEAWNASMMTFSSDDIEVIDGSEHFVRGRKAIASSGKVHADTNVVTPDKMASKPPGGRRVKSRAHNSTPLEVISVKRKRSSSNAKEKSNTVSDAAQSTLDSWLAKPSTKSSRSIVQLTLRSGAASQNCDIVELPPNGVNAQSVMKWCDKLFNSK